MALKEADAPASSTELQFQVRDNELFFVRASAEANCRVILVEMIHRSDGRLLEYFVVAGAPAERVLAAAAEASAIDDAEVIREDGDEALYEFVVSGPCIGGTLADAGAVVRDVVATDGIGYVVADVPPHAERRQVVQTVRERHDVELLACRTRDRPMPEFTRQEFRTTLADQLTDRQFETVRKAFANGYFTWPRESTAEECADALGISQPTFTQHIRTAQRKLFAALFDEIEETETVDIPQASKSISDYR
jgi:predicted DNA binding protein